MISRSNAAVTHHLAPQYTRGLHALAAGSRSPSSPTANIQSLLAGQLAGKAGRKACRKSLQEELAGQLAAKPPHLQASLVHLVDDHVAHIAQSRVHHQPPDEDAGGAESEARQAAGAPAAGAGSTGSAGSRGSRCGTGSAADLVVFPASAEGEAGQAAGAPAGRDRQYMQQRQYMWCTQYRQYMWYRQISRLGCVFNTCRR
jgi:hypothetical protein